ncbi:N-acylethanolamine-hydrolyzing acid amidase-like [Glandiceps talaboti]
MVSRLTLTLLAILCCYAIADDAFQAPRFVLNLDLPPEERWLDIASYWGKDEIQDYMKQIIARFVPESLVPAIDFIAADIGTYLPSPYKEEIISLAEYAEINIGDMVALNIVYDVTAFCTSIVAQDTNGIIWHGRNLDYPFGDILRNLTLIFDAQKNGETIYTATSFIGYTGVLTGMKPHHYTASIDQRDTGSILGNLVEVVNALIKHKSNFVSFLLRDTLTSVTYFDDAVEKLAYTEIVAPVYYIVGGIGPNEGAVITRNRKTAEDVWFIDMDQDRWFLVETNFDHWEPPPPHGNRRIPAINAMKKVGQDNINNKTMFDVMSVHPVLNTYTAYTAVMSASRPTTYNTWSRFVDEEEEDFIDTVSNLAINLWQVIRRTVLSFFYGLFD